MPSTPLDAKPCGDAMPLKITKTPFQTDTNPDLKASSTPTCAMCGNGSLPCVVCMPVVSAATLEHITPMPRTTAEATAEVTRLLVQTINPPAPIPLDGVGAG